jgi:hypothetical protein
MLCRMPRRARGSVTCSSAFSRQERPPGSGSMPGLTITGTSSQISAAGRAGWRANRADLRISRRLLPPGDQLVCGVIVAHR